MFRALLSGESMMNNAYLENTRDDFLYLSILCKQSLNCTGTATFDIILTAVTSLLTIDKHRA